MNADSKVNILMVDDQAANLLNYEAILAELGENLIKATSGERSLEHPSQDRRRGGLDECKHARS